MRVGSTCQNADANAGDGSCNNKLDIYDLLWCLRLGMEAAKAAVYDSARCPGCQLAAETGCALPSEMRYRARCQTYLVCFLISYYNTSRKGVEAPYHFPQMFGVGSPSVRLRTRVPEPLARCPICPIQLSSGQRLQPRHRQNNTCKAISSGGTFRYPAASNVVK